VSFRTLSDQNLPTVSVDHDGTTLVALAGASCVRRRYGIR